MPMNPMNNVFPMNGKIVFKIEFDREPFEFMKWEFAQADHLTGMTKKKLLTFLRSGQPVTEIIAFANFPRTRRIQMNPFQPDQFSKVFIKMKCFFFSCSKNE